MDSYQRANWYNWIKDNEEGLKFKADDFKKAKDPYKFLKDHKAEIYDFADAPDIPEIPDLTKTVEKLNTEYASIDQIPKSVFNRAARKANVSPNILKEAFEQAKAKEDVYINVQKAQAEKEQRRKEINNLPWYGKMFMSEAAKNRYVNNPLRSSFYVEKRKAELNDIIKNLKSQPFYQKATDEQKAEMLKEYTGELSQLAMSQLTGKQLSDMVDVGLGAAAVAGDVSPLAIPSVITGPIIRGIRGIKNDIEGDAEYTPSDFGKDLMVNAGLRYTPTAVLRGIERYGKGVSKDAFGRIKDAIYEGGVKGSLRQMKQDLAQLTGNAKELVAKKEAIREVLPEGTGKTVQEKRLENQFMESLEGNNFKPDIEKELQNQVYRGQKPDIIKATETVEKNTDDAVRTIEGTSKEVRGSNGKLYQTFDEEWPEIEGFLSGPGTGKYAELLQQNRGLTLGGHLVDFGKQGVHYLGEPTIKVVGNITSDPQPKAESKEEYDQKIKKLGLAKESKPEDLKKNKEDRWAQGFVTVEEMMSPEYQKWKSENIQNLY